MKIPIKNRICKLVTKAGLWLMLLNMWSWLGSWIGFLTNLITMKDPARIMPTIQMRTKTVLKIKRNIFNFSKNLNFRAKNLLLWRSVHVAFSRNKNVNWGMKITPQVPFTITQKYSKNCIQSTAKIHPKIVPQSCN